MLAEEREQPPVFARNSGTQEQELRKHQDGRGATHRRRVKHARRASLLAATWARTSSGV